MKGYQNENGHFTDFRPHYVGYSDTLYLFLKLTTQVMYLIQLDSINE